MDTVDVIDGVVQTAQPVNLVNNLSCQRRPPSIQSTPSKAQRSRRDQRLSVVKTTEFAPRVHYPIRSTLPRDMLAGKQKAIQEERDRKLVEAREDRAKIRAQQAAARYAKSTRPEDRAMLGSNPLQSHHSAESMPKASATCLRPQCDKSPGVGGRAPKNAQHLFVHSFTKLNLTNVYATYAEPKQHNPAVTEHFRYAKFVSLAVSESVNSTATLPSYMDTSPHTTTIPLNLIYDYPVKWSTFKTLRDFVQNFYDAIGSQKWSSSFEYTVENNILTLRANNVGFSYEWLLHIGASTKRTGNFAGYFGEGFKIASLCAVRDHRWNVSMASRDWVLRVCTSQVAVDNTSLCSLAYEIETRPTECSETVMKLSPFSDTDLIKAVLLSFYYPENPLFEKCLWQSADGAVFTRSDMSKPRGFPQTLDESGPGIVYAGFQAMGSFREPLVFCLHAHRNDDRDRGTYYRMQVVGLIERFVSHLPPEPSALILEKFKSRWYESPRKKSTISIVTIKSSVG